jgi:phytoene dehydrogenase-like protein
VATSLGRGSSGDLRAAYDAVIVGSGVNSLVAAARLARAGWSVCVLERAAEFGGACRTAEVTVRGFHHDVMSAWHPLWISGAAHAELGDELAGHGLQYANTDLPVGTVYPDGGAAFLYRDTDATAAEFDRLAPGDGQAWRRSVEEFLAHADLYFGMLGSSLWSRAGARLAWQAYRKLGARGVAEMASELLVSGRDWLTDTFTSERVRGLLAPWVLHAGLGPDAAGAGFMTKLITIALQDAGCPVPIGGSARLVQALVALIEQHGGVLYTDQDVQSILTAQRAAVGVHVAGGGSVHARRAVLASVTTRQLYGRLLADAPVPASIAQAGRTVRPGRAAMQIHIAMSESPRWDGDERIDRCADVHVTPGLDGVSRAVNEAERGLLPAEATLVVGQPLNLDPSRAPAGAGILWIQLQELPWHVKGDSAGEIDVGSGAWTESLRERYADRIMARLSRQITNLESATLARTVLSPADLEAWNVNLEHGDPYGGGLTLDQSFLWRPLKNHFGHETPIARLYQIGASTHPGPGLGGASGMLVADELLASGPMATIKRLTRSA